MAKTILREFLSGLSSGPVHDEAVRDLERALFQEWDTIDGPDEGGMQAYKLVGRLVETTASSVLYRAAWRDSNEFHTS